MKIVWNYKIPRRQGGQYMTRYGVMSNWLSIYIHYYHNGDDGEKLHDHPWQSWYSCVLFGWLNEHRQIADDQMYIVQRKAISICKMDGSIKHRISSVKPGTVTLFFGFNRTREWRFYSINNHNVRID